MKISRRNFLKKGLAGTLLLGAATVPQSLAALFLLLPKQTGRNLKELF